MAAFALNRTVLALERILGIAIMIKRRGLPSVFSMTPPAFGPKDAFVVVVFPMASNALHWGVLVSILRVTVDACDLFMFAPERELRLVVIEPRLFPILFGMTISTGRSQLSFMFIVFLMTGVALRRCGPVLHIRLVTGPTRNLLPIGMGPAKREIRF